MRSNFIKSASILVLCVFAASAAAAQSVKGTFKGTLHVGSTSSYLLYVGPESGDFAAFCFTNSSKAGQSILNNCKDGNCEITGTVDQGAPCLVDADTQKVLSGSGRVLSVTSARSLTPPKAVAPSRTALVPGVPGGPDVVVRSLYAVHNKQRGPFFQSSSRALVDKYFTRDLADLIWKDSAGSKDGVGVIDFDPLFNAQDVEIKNFKIGKPEPGEGNLKLSDVPVTFRNMGKEQLILFRLLQGTDRKWRISDIFYPDKESPIQSLKDHLKEYVGK